MSPSLAFNLLIQSQARLRGASWVLIRLPCPSTTCPVWELSCPRAPAATRHPGDPGLLRSVKELLQLIRPPTSDPGCQVSSVLTGLFQPILLSSPGGPALRYQVRGLAGMEKLPPRWLWVHPHESF